MKILFRNRETLGGMLFLLLGVYLIWEISTFAVATEKIRSLGPEFFPNVLAWSLTLLSVTLVVQGLRLPPAPILREGLGTGACLGPAAVLFGVLSFIWLITPLGFALWAFLFLAALQAALGERNLMHNFLFSLSITAVLYLMFAVALRIPLPRGFLAF